MDIISVNGLKKHFGEIKAVDGISFNVREGEYFGFLGVNGAGKSTTINMLATLIKQTSGSAQICGLTLGKDDALIRRSIGVVWQKNCLDDQLTVRENLSFRGALFGNDTACSKSKISELSDLLELDGLLGRRYGKLSGGQKRRCEIAAALMHSPKILFLDEPTTGLDPASRKSVWQAVEHLRDEQGTTIFLTTHYMEETAQANHIVIIDKGRIAAEGTPFELKEKYAKDSLRLYSDDIAALTARLGRTNTKYILDEDAVKVSLDSTIEALGILDTVRDSISGFEVIQGTMDDVFLAAKSCD